MSKQPTELVYPDKGSAESRLQPRIATGDVRKHGPRMGSVAGVRQTSTGSLSADGDAARRARIGLPPRFLKG